MTLTRSLSQAHAYTHREKGRFAIKERLDACINARAHTKAEAMLQQEGKMGAKFLIRLAMVLCLFSLA